MKNQIEVISTPRQVEAAITGMCNLKCRYCFYSDELVGRSDLPTEHWLNFFDELGSLNVMSTTLTGGEPFMRRDLFELIDGIISNKMRYDILSNGTLINEKIISEFKKGKRLSRLNFIQVSVDGSTAEIHNSSRPNSFERMINAIRIMLRENFPVVVRVTISPYNIDDLDNIAALLLDDLGLASFGTDEVNLCGRAAENSSDIMLTSITREKVSEKLLELNSKYKGRINAQSGPLAMAEQLRVIDEAMCNNETEQQGHGYLTACGGAFSKIAVLHDGVIVPCHYLSELHMGQIGKDSLQDIWLNHEFMIQLRERQNVPIQTLESCKDCRYAGFCTGGCPSIPLKLSGTLIDRNPYQCYRIAKGEEVYEF